MRHDSDCLHGICNLSATWGGIAVICQSNLSYITDRQLQATEYTHTHPAVNSHPASCNCQTITSGRMTVICQLHEAGWRLSVSYMRQDDGYLSVTWGRMAGICQLHEAERRLSVRCMRQDVGYLSVTRGPASSNWHIPANLRHVADI
jgi:hypothetical protein